MNSTSPAPVPSKAALWTGRVLSLLPSLMLLFSGAMKFTTSPEMTKGLEHLQLDPKIIPGIGALEIACTVIYLIPRTAVLGAILLTGYLGGAILTHLRVGDQYLTHIIFGVILWGGIYLRDPRLRALIPFKK